MSQISINTKAHILSQALPYIQKHAKETVVVKYGGNAMINDELKSDVMADIVLMQAVGIKVVLVHGGGPEISTALKKMNKETKFVGGLRYTDEETMQVVQMVLAGKVNKELVANLCMRGGKSVGICGLDNMMIKAKKLDNGEDLGFVGEVTEINNTLLFDLLNLGYIPVISSTAIGDKGELYNINADTVAAKVAISLQAKKLILMTDIKGLLRDKDNEDTLIHSTGISSIKHLKDEGIITGGMIPKIDCCVDAILNGVDRCHILDGRISHSILIELFSDEGVGTMLYNG